MALIRKIFIVICLMVFCGSAAYILHYVYLNMTAQKTISEVAESRSRGLAEVYAKNNDLVGWIYIEGTKIDYPVMQTTSDPEFYLHRDFNKEYSESGTPFVDSFSSIARATRVDGVISDYSTWNWLLYGHHMKFGTMFHDLMKFEDKEFWEGHKTLEFDRIRIDAEGNITEVDEDYEIIAAAYSQIYPKNSNAFKYYSYAGYYDEESFYDFIAGVKAEACYDTGLSATYGDQLVTLSTCAYHTNNGRFYIVAKRSQ